VRPASFDVVGYTMMSCANLQDAFERLVRYLRILSDALDHLPERRARPLPRVVRAPRRRTAGAETADGVHSRHCGDLLPLGERTRSLPVEVALSYPAPRDLAPYRTAFRCPVSFGARLSSLLYALDDLTRPLSTSNPTLAALHDRYAGDYLEHFDRGQTSYRVREVIIRRLPDGEPRRDQVARELCMSERTLQRRLEEEASSFVQLLNDTRRELAEQYLNRLHLSLAQAAYLLGFSEQSSFFRACKRWFGLPPGSIAATCTGLRRVRQAIRRVVVSGRRRDLVLRPRRLSGRRGHLQAFLPPDEDVDEPHVRADVGEHSTGACACALATASR